MNAIKYIQSVGIERANDVLNKAPECGQPLYYNTLNGVYMFTGYQNSYFMNGVWGGIDDFPSLQGQDIKAVSLHELKTILANYEKVLASGGAHGYLTYLNGEVSEADRKAIEQYKAIEPIPLTLLVGAKRYIESHSPEHIKNLLLFAPEGAELFNNGYIRNVCSEGYIDHFAKWNGVKWLQDQAHREYVNEAVSVPAIKRIVDSGINFISHELTNDEMAQFGCTCHKIINRVQGQFCESCTQDFEGMTEANNHPEINEKHINLVIPFIKKITLDAAKKVVAEIPNGADFYHPENQCFVKNIDGEHLEIAEAEPKTSHVISFDSSCRHKYRSDCDCINGWAEDSAWLEYINILIPVAELKRIVDQMNTIEALGGIGMVETAINALQQHAKTDTLDDLQLTNLAKYQQWVVDYTAITSE